MKRYSSRTRRPGTQPRGLGISGTVPAALAGTQTTVRLEVSNTDGSDSESRNITVQQGMTNISLGGLEFTADSISLISSGYRLTGAVNINGIMSYSGTMDLTGPDGQGFFHMGGTGILSVPSVIIPGLGPLVLYDGVFDLKFKDGGIHNFIEEHTRFAIAGWTLKIDSLNFVSDGVRISGSVSIPQYNNTGTMVHAAAEVEATASRGVRLLSGGLEISKIGLAGGFSLEDISISYESPTNTFEGEGTLKTAAVGFTVGIEVIDGCPNGAEITIQGVPIVLGSTGLQLDNYGIQAENLCGNSPFGVGIHTDLTLVGNSNPDLLSFSDMTLMYYPLTTLNGTGTVRVLTTDLVQAGFYFNDAENDCDGGLCIRGELGIPSLSNAWIYGNLDASVIVLPSSLSMWGEQVMQIQIPRSCRDMGLPFWACLPIHTYCWRGYPCVLASTMVTFRAQPGANPEASLTSSFGILGHDFYVTVTYSEDHDGEFHFHLGDENDTKQLVFKSLGPEKSQAVEVITVGTTDAYLAMHAGGGAMPEFRIIDPNGVEYDRNGAEGIDYFEDIEYLEAVYALENPIPGRWTLEASGATGNVDYVSHIVNRPPDVVITNVSSSGSGYNVRWTGEDPEDAATVDLYYSTSFDGPLTGLVSAGLNATGSEKNTYWDTSSIPTGTYYLKAVISDGVTLDITFTYPTPVTVIPSSAPAAPTGLSATPAAAGVVDLSWHPGFGAAGSIVHATPGGRGQEVVVNVGNRYSYTLEGLDRNLGYRITVVSFDEEGLKSPPSTAVDVSWQECSLECSAAVPVLAGRGDQVRFEGGASPVGCSGELAIEWDFGDGDHGNHVQERHRYAEPGDYVWNYRTEIGGRTCNRNGAITVEDHSCTLNVIQPLGETTLEKAIPIPVMWTSNGAACSGSVIVELMAGDSIEEVLADEADGGSLSWAPGPDLDESLPYRIRVTDTLNPAYTHQSAPFRVAAAEGPSIAGAGTNLYLVPASAHAPGMAGTSWVSDVVVYNSSESSTDVNLFYFGGNDDHHSATGRPIPVPKNASVALGDVVSNTFGQNSSTGTILIGSDKPLLVTSRTYNDASSGTYGQFVPGLSVDAALGPADEARLIGLTRSSGFRTNIGFANANGEELRVTVSLYRTNGDRIRQESYTVEPYGYLQKNDIIGINIPDAYAIVSSNTAGAKFFTYASVVDNASGDPILVLPSETAATGMELFVPGAAHVTGAAGTNWRTDLEIHNPGITRAEFTVALLKRDWNNTMPLTEFFSLDGGKSIRYEDVLDEVFSFEGSAALRIKPTSGEVMVSARTYNDVVGGTYGQFIPGVTTGTAAISEDHKGRLIQLSRSASSSGGFRTNIGFVNPGGSNVMANVELFEADGTHLGALSYTLKPYEYNQVGDILGKVTGATVENAFAILTTTSGGSFLAYASVVDNRSGDPVYMGASGGGGTTPPSTTQDITITLPGGVTMELAHIPAGSFEIGSPPDERGRDSDEHQHRVTLTKGYYIGKYEVTQTQWEALMGSNPSYFSSCGENCPLEDVSWNDICGGTTGADCVADSFIGKLNAYLGTTVFRLPTEAEWERAARAGTPTPFSFDTSSNPEWNTHCRSFPDAENYMWWCGNDNGHTEEVGSKQPNPWGLYDMHGNVWEWVADRYGVYEIPTNPDPTGSRSGSSRVARGGSWNYSARYCRSAERSGYLPDDRHHDLGFRLSRSE